MTTDDASLVRREPRTLGSLPPIGPIAYGQWRYTTGDVGEARALLEAALDAGMNLIDTADVYGLDWGGTGPALVLIHIQYVHLRTGRQDNLVYPFYLE